MYISTLRFFFCPILCLNFWLLCIVIYIVKHSILYAVQTLNNHCLSLSLRAANATTIHLARNSSPVSDLFVSFLCQYLTRWFCHNIVCYTNIKSTRNACLNMNCEPEWFYCVYDTIPLCIKGFYRCKISRINFQYFTERNMSDFNLMVFSYIFIDSI